MSKDSREIEYYTLNNFELYSIVVQFSKGATFFLKLYNYTLEEYYELYLSMTHDELFTLFEVEDALPEYVIEEIKDFLDREFEIQTEIKIHIDAFLDHPIGINQFEFKVYQNLIRFDNEQYLPNNKNEFILDSIKILN